MVKGRPGVSRTTEPLIWFSEADGQDGKEGHQTTYSWNKKKKKGGKRMQGKNGKDKGGDLRKERSEQKYEVVKVTNIQFQLNTFEQNFK